MVRRSSHVTNPRFYQVILIAEIPPVVMFVGTEPTDYTFLIGVGFLVVTKICSDNFTRRGQSNPVIIVGL